jgi:nitrous oxidase accessory protein NosD
VLLAPFTTPVPGAAVLTMPDGAALRAAIQEGGLVSLRFNGKILLHQALVVTTNTTLDATGYTVALDGGNAVRHFVVSEGVTLRLKNLALLNGGFTGAAGETNQPGKPAFGGSIYNGGGLLELEHCAFSGNQAVGGKGGPTAHL